LPTEAPTSTLLTRIRKYRVNGISDTKKASDFRLVRFQKFWPIKRSV
jgi:hypothetical protein